MEIQGPLVVEELQEANVLAVPKLLRGSVRRRTRQTLNPSKWRLWLVALIGGLYLLRVLFDPGVGGVGKPALFGLLAAVLMYQLFFASKAARRGYESRIAKIDRVTSVDTDGLRAVDKKQTIQFHAWADYESWREGSLVFLVRGPNRLSSIVPKRGLTPQQVDALRVQLALHMPGSA